MSAALSQTVDARLAAAAAASQGSGNGTPKLQSQQQQVQQQQHHHHHHHPSASMSAMPQLPTKTKKQLQELASQPSQDREGYYDDDYEGEAVGLNNPYNIDIEGDDGEDDCSMYDITPKLSNRGNKLVPGAKFIRKGRLGGWENHEIFTSRSSFPSSNNPSSMTGGGALSSTGNHRLPSLTGGSGKGAGKPGSILSQYHITPNLSLVPTSSTLAARPDRDIHLSSISPTTGLHTIDSYNAHSSKRRKLHTTHTGLASTSGPSANHTSAPLRAYLPIPPQNPIELVSSPLISRTFSSKNRTLEKLSLSATELIEQYQPLLRALTRLLDFMRGNSVAGSKGVVGLPFLDEEGRMVMENDSKAEEAEQVKETAADKGQKEGEGSDSRSTLPQNAGDTGSTESTENGTSRKRRRSDEAMEVDAESAQPRAAENGDDSAVQTKITNEQVVPAEAAVASESAANGSTAGAAAAANGTSQDANMDAGDKLASSVGVEAAKTDKESEKTDAGLLMDGPEAAKSIEAEGGLDAPVNGGGYSRSSSPSSAQRQPLSNEDEENEHDQEVDEDGEQGQEGQAASAQRSKKTKEPLRKTARPSDSVLRIADPMDYVYSLFVSNEDIWVSDQSGQGGPNGEIQGTPVPPAAAVPNAAAGAATPAATPTSGTFPANSTTNGHAPAPTSATHTRITPAEQLMTTQLALSELTKFLSDSLEYQDRLSEIRDSVLGVEKRRKGVWSMARGFAHQMLWEDEHGDIGAHAGLGGPAGMIHRGKGRNGGIGDGDM